jgi:hypothetical protein
LSAIDEKNEKINLALTLDPAQFKATTLFKLQVAEVKIELLYQGEFKDNVLEFLKIYFRNFETFTGAADVQVHYWQLPGKLGDSKWPQWNDWAHELDYRNSQSGYDVLIARDFVAKINVEGTQIFAHGPIWSLGTCDSIDNIIAYVLGRKIIHKNGVILHAACVVKQDEAYVFFGASGAGKSTLAKHCYDMNELKVISADQVIIKFWNNALYAQVMPTTIPEFPLDHPAREVRPMKVKCLLHLVQKNEHDFEFKKLDSIDWVKYFMRELVYRNEFSSAREILDLSLRMAENPDTIRGEMSYKKGSDFFPLLENTMRVL